MLSLSVTMASADSSGWEKRERETKRRRRNWYMFAKLRSFFALHPGAD